MNNSAFSIGFRAHDFGRFDNADDLAATVADCLEPSCIQLAIKKIFNNPPSVIDSDIASSIKASLDRRRVGIAILGCYINPIHPDPEERERQLSYFERHLELANDLGCPYVGTETGSRSPDCSYNEGTCTESAFLDFQQSLKRLLKVAERNNSFVAIEPVAWTHTIDTARKMYTIIRIMDSPSLKVIYDPVNLTPRNGFQSESQAKEFFDEAIELLGPYMVAIHCKDYVMQNGIKKGDMTAGTGIMNWLLQARLLRKSRAACPILLENHQPKLLKDQTIPFVKRAFSL